MSSEKSKWIKMYDVSEQYSVNFKVGGGTYGIVFKAKNLKDSKYYGIKKLKNDDFKMQNQGFPITALRQIMLLKQLQHPNVIKLNEIILSKPSKRNLFRGSTFLVFEYMEHDLTGILRAKTKFNLPQVKCIAKQLLEGVSYIHSLNLLHRDIKCANILMNKKGQLKLADFGLGRRWKAESCMTYKVVTLWYRAPQLLLGCKTYDLKVDVWSVGCVLAELLTGQVLFRKQTDFAQMERILQILGDMKTNDIPEDLLKTYELRNEMIPPKNFQRQFQSYLLKLNPQLNKDAIDLLSGLLDLNPKKRLSCQEALNHKFFTNQPIACKPSEIRKFEFEMKEFFKESTEKVEYEKDQADKQSQKYYKDSHRDGSFGYQRYDRYKHGKYSSKDKIDDYKRKSYNKETFRHKRERREKSSSSNRKKESSSSFSSNSKSGSSSYSKSQQRSRNKNYKERKNFYYKNDYRDREEKYQRIDKREIGYRIEKQRNQNGYLGRKFHNQKKYQKSYRLNEDNFKDQYPSRENKDYRNSGNIYTRQNNEKKLKEREKDDYNESKQFRQRSRQKDKYEASQRHYYREQYRSNRRPEKTDYERQKYEKKEKNIKLRYQDEKYNSEYDGYPGTNREERYNSQKNYYERPDRQYNPKRYNDEKYQKSDYERNSHKRYQAEYPTNRLKSTQVRRSNFSSNDYRKKSNRDWEKNSERQKDRYQFENSSKKSGFDYRERSRQKKYRHRQQEGSSQKEKKDKRSNMQY